MGNVTIDWEGEVKAAFRYEEDRIYLNSAGAGLSWSGQPEAAASYYTELARLGSRAQPTWVQRAEEARKIASRLLRVPANNVMFLRNTSDVINLAANSVTWHPGDEVVVADDDFPSVVLPWDQAQRFGGEVIRVHVDSEDDRESSIISRITPRTKVVALTHVNAVTGTRVNLDAIGRVCREVGALFVVDGIEALGAIPVDLTHVDVYGAAVFKWLLSGFGTSIAYFSDRAQRKLTPAYRGYRNPGEDPGFEYSDPNYPGLYVLGPTLEHLESLGWENIYHRVKTLTQQVAAEVEKVGLTPLTPVDGRAGIISVRLEDAHTVVEKLEDRGIDVVQRGGCLRVSPHFYNTAEEIQSFGAALNAC